MHRWNHCSVLVEAIPTWKVFIFGGECAEYNEGNARAFGEYVNSSCFLDLGTEKWATFASDPETYPEIPKAREYAAMAYDPRDSRLLLFGGWNNGWFNDLHALYVGKIVGPSYAITASDPCLGQLTGNVPLRISGQGFKDANIKVVFTAGSRPIDGLSKFSIEVPGQFVSETELTCVTPNFEQFGPKECVMQISIASDAYTTTWITFNYFLNTRANKSLAYGPGLLSEVCPGTEVEFIIQARNDLGENRNSGNDNFQVRIKKIRAAVVEEVVAPTETQGTNQEEEEEKVVVPVKKAPEEIIECKIVDKDDGSYACSYIVDEECSVNIEILFENEKGDMVHVRGSPYTASFVSSAKAADNLMTGGALDRHIKKELERLQHNMTENKKDMITKDKDLKDVKVLLGVKEVVENTFNGQDTITLHIDQLDEAIKLFTAHKLSKDSQIKGFNKINKEWNDLKVLAKTTKKDIAPLVSQENDRNNREIKRLEEDIITFT